MGYFQHSLNKYMKAVLTFGDGQVYEASMRNRNDQILKNVSVRESEARTTANLLGVMDSNNCSFTIMDKEGALVPSNALSPYKDLIGSGIKVELYEVEEDLTGAIIDTKKKGTYYTDSWGNSIVGQKANIATVYCYDRLSYIGQKELPALGRLENMTMRDLVKELFTKLGLVEDIDYTIDSSLNLDIMFAVTKGTKVSHTLNEIAQALVARITCDRDGIIRIKPAFKIGSYSSVGTLSESNGANFSLRNNKDIGNYTYVKVGYVNLSMEDTPQILNVVNSVKIKAGENKIIEDIEIPANTQVIDAVQCRCEWTDTVKPITKVRYNRTQSGLTVSIKNVSTSDIVVNIFIYGKSIYTSNAFVYDSTKDTSGSIFEIDNIYIQDKVTAQTFADNVKKYILSVKHRVSIVAYVDMELECGTVITVESSSQNINGLFYINGLDYTIENGYRVVIDAIRIK